MCRKDQQEQEGEIKGRRWLVENQHEQTGTAGNKKQTAQTADSKNGWNRTSAGKQARPAPAGTPARTTYPILFNTNSLTQLPLIPAATQNMKSAFHFTLQNRAAFFCGFPGIVSAKF
jgi:hypothetical protein